ncbi:grasp-with-spasm system ATP-grasp peptide maturase [Hymenobacter oligotrophus]|uniref:Grasp-with-spasm system ATP-grasp peptide maturase n=1 Tax=Hymenobacter oligotrophus TaxID=2319843 RepID=A0A3B7RAB3_9BACT|nr:grasp-with-spasm system ATP-grasp peptide maturase [Hymenobacter oligotrophus]AYA37709.1 grasp-with-spasm system ATP-grasp peptide maturase [Hymenobacter oligotrophus]
MILILTTDGDLSADVVIDWLHYYQQPFLRLNSIDLIRQNLRLQIRNGQAPALTLGKHEIALEDIRAVWFRKFGFFTHSEEYLQATGVVAPGALAHLVREFNVVLDGLLGILKPKRWLTNPQHVNVNKPYCLHVAVECGLRIPDSYVVNETGTLGAVAAEQPLISKSIKDGYLFNRPAGGAFTMFTTGVPEAELPLLAPRFLPSLVQERVTKDYELRVFYLLGKCYAMAIFSQRDQQTSLDFRQYNLERPNRNVPYQLPRPLEKKIHHLMKRMQLNCGSLDFIRGTDGHYYFLEINATGQFGMVDFPCNYGLHRKVAEALIKLDRPAHEKALPIPAARRA